MQDTGSGWAATPGGFEPPEKLVPPYLEGMAESGLPADEWYFEELRRIGLDPSLTEFERRSWPRYAYSAWMSKGDNPTPTEQVSIWGAALALRAFNTLLLLNEYANTHPLQPEWQELAARLDALSSAFLEHAGVWTEEGTADDTLKELERTLSS